MRLTTLIILLVAVLTPNCTSQTIPNKDLQVAAAVMAAPEDVRAEATVMGYNSAGQLVTIRTGTNNMICLADDPNGKGFSVAAYHRDLEPFMARGRELKAEGKKRAEINDIREAEAKSGKLKMPSQPTTLHILFGEKAKYDPSTQTVDGGTYRYVVYIPWATAESTGLPLKPVTAGGPWLMDAGTHKAHIMISTPGSN